MIEVDFGKVLEEIQVKKLGEARLVALDSLKRLPPLRIMILFIRSKDGL